MSLDSLEQRLAAAEASLMAMPDADAVFAALVTTPSVPFAGRTFAAGDEMSRVAK